LELMYLNNAYHFYSPDPGPACLLKMSIEYEDGTRRWKVIPNRSDFVLGVNYQRRLSLTESTNQLQPPLPLFPDELMLRRRGGGHPSAVPLLPSLPLNPQFRIPLPCSKMMLQSYARYACRAFPNLDDPDKKATGVKIYRVVHVIPQPKDVLERGGQLDDPT